MQADVYGIKEMQKSLKELEPKLDKAMQRDAKTIAKPGADRVKSVIPSVAPLTGKDGQSGMLNNGRLGWGIGKPANSVTVRYRSGRSKQFAVTSLVAIWVNSPATAMVDVAGKGRSSNNGRQSRKFMKNGTLMTMTINGQGDAMISKLKQQKSNNFAWPAVEREIPRMNAEIRLVIGKYADRLNRELR